MMSAFFSSQPTLNKLFNNCIKFIDIRLVLLEKTILSKPGLIRVKVGRFPPQDEVYI